MLLTHTRQPSQTIDLRWPILEFETNDQHHSSGADVHPENLFSLVFQSHSLKRRFFRRDPSTSAARFQLRGLVLDEGQQIHQLGPHFEEVWHLAA
jgi:hypothetical protein